MGEQHGDLVEDRRASRKGLLPRRGDADNDVAEDAPGELRELTFVHGERQHVRRAILSAIDLVQLMDSLIVG